MIAMFKASEEAPAICRGFFALGFATYVVIGWRRRLQHRARINNLLGGVASRG
jgi:hypothetical protein